MSQEEIISKVKEAVEKDPQKDVIKSISLFGSFLHGDYTDKSDVDLLFESKNNISYFTLFAIQDRIAKQIGRPVDLLTKEELSRYFRDKVVNEAKKIYQND